MILVFETLFTIGISLSMIGSLIFTRGLLEKDIKKFRTFCLLTGACIFIVALVLQIPYYNIAS